MDSHLLFRAPFVRNIAKGVGIGLFIATGFTAWITFLRLTSGTQPFDRLQTTYSATVALYYGGGLIGGLLVGLLWPLHRWPLGSALLGILGVFPTYFGVEVTRTTHTSPFTLDNVAKSAVIAFLVGGALGISIWLDDNPTSSNWIERLRHPTSGTISKLWSVVLSVAAASYFGLSHWTGAWPPALVIFIAFATFIIPLAVAGIVTATWLRQH
jgi:hypothetical protein